MESVLVPKQGRKFSFGSLLFVSIVFLSLAGFGFYKYKYQSFLNLNESHSWLLLNKNFLHDEEPVNLSEEIPLIIHQTYFLEKRVPPKVAENIAKYAPEFTRKFYDDEAIKSFLKEHFDAKVLIAFNSLKMGAHKADLFRYCVLYIKGGVYLDIKTELLSPIKSMFLPNKITTVISRKRQEIYQRVIAAPPKQPIFLALIAAILKSGSRPPYNLFIRDFMKYIYADTGSTSLGEGNSAGKTQEYFLYREICNRNAKECEDGLDRYGLCCNIFSNSTRVIKSRYSDYPW